jgi:hypothetical protein
LAAGIAAWHLAPLTWDGAFLLFTVLDSGAPVAPFDRMIHVPLQIPVLVARQITDDLSTLRLLFALPYTLVPTIGVVLSWLVCRRSQPRLFIWPVLAITLGALPGQFFFTSEGPMAAALMWPILLALLVGLRPAHLPLLAVLGLAVWTAHPVSAGLLGGDGLLALVLALRDPGRRWPLLAVAAACLLPAVARVLTPLTGYEADSLTPQRLLDAYNVAVVGWPLVALACMLSAAALTLAEAWLLGWRSAWLGSRPGAALSMAVRTSPPLLALGAGAALVPWARDAASWAHSLDYRFVLHSISLGLMLVAVADSLLVADQRVLHRLWRTRRVTVYAAGVALLVVLTVQSRSWFDLRTRFTASLVQPSTTCVPQGALPDVTGTALDHWATTSLAIVLQGRAPQRLVLSGNGCGELATTGDVRVAPWELRPAGSGWFQLPTSSRSATERPTLTFTVGATFGQPPMARLDGYGQDTVEIVSDRMLRVALRWHALGAASISYKAYVHVLDEDGRMVAQRDDVPFQGRRPTTDWVPGDDLVDVYEVPLPPGLRPGAYRLAVGLYDPADGERLGPVLAADGSQEPNREAILGSVRLP